MFVDHRPQAGGTALPRGRAIHGRGPDTGRAAASRHVVSLLPQASAAAAAVRLAPHVAADTSPRSAELLRDGSPRYPAAARRGARRGALAFAAITGAEAVAGRDPGNCRGAQRSTTGGPVAI